MIGVDGGVDVAERTASGATPLPQPPSSTREVVRFLIYSLMGSWG